MTLQFPTHGLIIGAVRGGHAMQYMTSRQKATEWSVTKRMVNYWCANGQIEGAYKEGSRWWIPADVERPGEDECLRQHESVHRSDYRQEERCGWHSGF